MIEGVIIKKINRYADNRGWLAEIFRRDELIFDPAMAYASLTESGVVRGPHEHKEQSDCFVFFGPGNFRLYLWDHRDKSATSGEKLELEVGVVNPTLVIVPPGVIHGYKCISSDPAISLNFPNRLYRGVDRKEEIDEIRWEGIVDSPYQIK